MNPGRMNITGEPTAPEERNGGNTTIRQKQQLKILIAYMSRHGCTENASKILAKHLQGDITIRNLKKGKCPDIQPFEVVIIGGSIHAGQVQQGIKNFCHNNMEGLMKKKTGLFLCCMETGETARIQFEEAFPLPLRNHAVAKGFFGGKFDFEKMSYFEKMIVEKAVNITQSIDMLNEKAIRDFAGSFH